MGIKTELITKDAAAAEILTRPVKFHYRPAIVEFDRKINEVESLNEPVNVIDPIALDLN